MAQKRANSETRRRGGEKKGAYGEEVLRIMGGKIEFAENSSEGSPPGTFLKKLGLRKNTCVRSQMPRLGLL